MFCLNISLLRLLNFLLSIRWGTPTSGHNSQTSQCAPSWHFWWRWTTRANPGRDKNIQHTKKTANEHSTSHGSFQARHLRWRLSCMEQIMYFFSMQARIVQTCFANLQNRRTTLEICFLACSSNSIHLHVVLCSVSYFLVLNQIVHTNCAPFVWHGWQNSHVYWHCACSKHNFEFGAVVFAKCVVSVFFRTIRFQKSSRLTCLANVPEKHGFTATIQNQHILHIWKPFPSRIVVSMISIGHRRAEFFPLVYVYFNSQFSRFDPPHHLHVHGSRDVLNANRPNAKQEVC